MVENPEGIYGIYKNISETKDRIAELDKNLVSTIGKESADVQQTILKWQNNVNSTISKVGSSNGGGSGGGSSYKVSGGTTTKGTAVTANDGKSPTADNSNYNTTTKSDNYAFKINDKVRSNVGNWATGYDSDSKGNLKKPPNQWWGNAFRYGGDKATVIARDNYNGTNYYKIKFSSGVTHWLNGHQLKYKTGGFAYETGPA